MTDSEIIHQAFRDTLSQTFTLSNLWASLSICALSMIGILIYLRIKEMEW